MHHSALDEKGVIQKPEHPGPGDQLLRVETRLAVVGRGAGTPGQPLNVPLMPASNFRAALHGTAGRECARDDGTPGWEAFEELIGDLEGGSAVSFSSGMAAITAVLDAVRGSDLVWLETPSNPMLHLVDIAAVTSAATPTGTLVAVDNTFATPLLQNPRNLGADFVVHSATKFIGGHSDLLLGAVVSRRPEDHARLVRRREVAGATPGALECFLALRGARTLAVRLRQAQESAGELARRLAAHPAVSRVRYPGLPAHPQHDLAARQMRGFGAVLSFEVPDAAAADAVCRHVQVIAHATSVGGVETTIERRARLPGQEHVPAGLLRLSVGCEHLSVGCEHLEDLWADLTDALALG